MNNFIPINDVLRNFKKLFCLNVFYFRTEIIMSSTRTFWGYVTRGITVYRARKSSNFNAASLHGSYSNDCLLFASFSVAMSRFHAAVIEVNDFL